MEILLSRQCNSHCKFSAGNILGATNVVAGATSYYLSDGETAGTWYSSDPSIATINSSTGEVNARWNNYHKHHVVSSTGPCPNDTATLALTVNAQQVTTSNGGTVYTCNGIFMDDGGSLGNYVDNQSYVFTICPDSADLTSLDFTAFDVDNSDYLKIYDGNTDTAALLGTYNNSNPLSGIIQASLANATGCLTFEFYADGSNNAAGWQATINCVDTASMEVDFVTNLTTVCLGDTITFTDSTTNNPTSWNWDFGDGNSSTAQNPTHVYATAGTYDVKLVVTNAYTSDSISKTGYIMINAPPTR